MLEGALGTPPITAPVIAIRTASIWVKLCEKIQTKRRQSQTKTVNMRCGKKRKDCRVNNSLVKELLLSFGTNFNNSEQFIGCLICYSSHLKKGILGSKVNLSMTVLLYEECQNDYLNGCFKQINDKLYKFVLQKGHL